MVPYRDPQVDALGIGFDRRVEANGRLVPKTVGMVAGPREARPTRPVSRSVDVDALRAAWQARQGAYSPSTLPSGAPDSAYLAPAGDLTPALGAGAPPVAPAVPRTLTPADVDALAQAYRARLAL